MDLRETILKEHSKDNCLRIVKWIGSSQQRFDELFQLFLHDEYRVIQRAAWPLSNAVVEHPELIRKHFRALLDNLRKPNRHEAVKRNTLRLLEYVDIPKRFQGEIMDLCFSQISDPREKPAVKASGITILDKLSQLYPEIRQELITIIEERWDTESPAFKARARKILKRKR